MKKIMTATGVIVITIWVLMMTLAVYGYGITGIIYSLLTETDSIEETIIRWMLVAGMPMVGLALIRLGSRPMTRR